MEPETNTPRANAAFVVLARNKELDGVIQSLKSIERHFNRWYHYPYVFLNDGVFSEEFKNTVQNYTSGSVEFGKIDPSMWGFPDWVDHDEAAESIAKQGDAAIMYGGMASYHHMCRFYSGYGTLLFSTLARDLFLTRIGWLGFSTSMSCWQSTNGTGAWSPRSNTSVISLSMVSSP